MCGLCGSFTQKGTVLSKRDRQTRARAIEGLLIANQQRGVDRTGVAGIDFDGAYELNKSAVRASRYVNLPQAQELMRSEKPILIGHTRMTSMGNDIMDQNAHPFVEGSVIGAHNGVINNYTELDSSVRVDSQAVFRELDKHPDAMDYVFSRVNGSCALTWWDGRDPEAMYIVAHMNPLQAAIVSKINTVFWSSVDDHLETVMRTAYGSDVEYIDIKKDTVYRMDASDIYKWAEEKVTFAQSHYSTKIRVYEGGQYGWDDDDMWGMTGPKAITAPAASSMPVAMTDEEEERYEEHWDRLIALSAKESDDENEMPSAKSVSERIHDMDEATYDTSQRFQVDDLDGSLMCGYCEKSLGERGVWDDKLQMLLCRFCQSWWDKFGHYKKGDEPGHGTTAIQLYTGK